MAHSPYCPSCGFNFVRDETVHAHDWELAPGSTAWKHRRLPLSRCESAFLHTLAAVHGRPVDSEVIGSRISQAEDPGNLAAVIAYKLRKKLPALLGMVPFETVRTQGYRWVG